MDDFTLDNVARAILRVIQERGDIGQAELGTLVGASPASCWRRIKAMEQAGILGRTVRLVNADRVGKAISVFCQVKMKSHDPVARKKFEAFVQAQNEIMECHSMSGDWDYLLRLAVGDIHEYEMLLMQKILTHEAVLTSSSHFSLKSVKYSTALPV